MAPMGGLARRFPPPWTVTENAESFWVQDAGGQTVGWFYFRHKRRDRPLRQGADRERGRCVNFARLFPI
jgi:hypothetical protein